jgi:hypothetical protein
MALELTELVNYQDKGPGEDEEDNDPVADIDKDAEDDTPPQPAAPIPTHATASVSAVAMPPPPLTQLVDDVFGPDRSTLVPVKTTSAVHSLTDLELSLGI